MSSPEPSHMIRWLLLRFINSEHSITQAEIDGILANHADSHNISFWAEAAALIQRILQHTGLID